MKQKYGVRAELHYYSDRLKQKLSEMISSPVTLVEAPSGYGKTTAIRDFLEESISKSTPVYWFTAAEEAPASGFRRLCLEIDKIDNKAGHRLLKIELPNAATVGEAADALRSVECRRETYFVIDNFQFLQDSLLPDFFAALVEHGGKGLHIIIITQMLKRNMLARIAGRCVLHITFTDLRLDTEDIRRYYALAGVQITSQTAGSLRGYTEGWIIAVYLQLCAFQETGSFSDKPGGILTLMEHLVWDQLTEAQQTFLLRLSPFEMLTMRQIYSLMDCDMLSEEKKDALECPFIRNDSVQQRYELHGILTELLILKRRERGTDFERECLLRAGDLCRDDGRNREAMCFYWQVKDYERMLSLDLSHMIFEEIGNTPFSELALDAARNCPEEIKKRYPLSLLRIAWALLTAGMTVPFEKLMEELRLMLEAGNTEEAHGLLGEWTLLSSYLDFPDLAGMTEVLTRADKLLKGKSSRVILPSAPWCFGSYCPLAEFHVSPGEADREADALEKYIALYAKMTNGHGIGADVLFRAELAYQRGDLTDAEVLSYKAAFLAESRQQSIVQLGAATQLAGIALHKADMSGWQNAVRSMEQAASYPQQNNFVVRSVLDIVRGVLLFELKYQENIADWLKKGELSGRSLRKQINSDALFVYLNYLMHQGEFPRMLGIMQAAGPDLRNDNPFAYLLFSVLEAVAHVQMGRRDRAAALVETAAQRALPDGMIFPLASYSWMLQGLSDELIAEKYPEHLKKYKEIKERFALGWDTLHNGMLPDELPPDLTPREYEVAKLAAEGLRNSEIAEKLVVSESTVRAHMRTIFQKLDIDRRAKLAEKLK